MRSFDLNGTIIYNGKSSADLGVIVNKLPVIRKPKRKGSTTSIPGRSGDLAREENGFENYVQPYEISITDTERGISAISGDLAAWLLNTRGYIRLEDSFDPDVYRMARFEGTFDIEPIMEQDGKAVIEFDCCPQRYLKSGEQEIEITSSGVTLYNPTAQEAYPLIKLDMWPGESSITEETVEMEWDSGKYIASKNGNPSSKAFRVQSTQYSSGLYYYVSQEIDLSGVQEVVISAYADSLVVSGRIVEARTCYTFLDENRNPVKKNKDTQILRNERMAVPSGARYLRVGGAKEFAPMESNWVKVEPAVTLVRITGGTLNGDLTINDQSVIVEDSPRPVIYLDCDRHDAYFEDGGNANNYVEFSQLDNSFPTFPNLIPGTNLLTTSGENVSVTVWPRWWML